MTSINTEFPASKPPVKPVSLLAIILLGIILWAGEYIRRDLWEPDEARFALVAREMQASGQWLIPYRQGEFYTHKPPLMFWLINAFSSFSGGYIGNVATRLPSFLGAIMALWAASRLASRWFNERTGWWTVMILSTSFLFWDKGGFGQIDALLCGLEMMALYFLFTSSDASSSARLFAAYACMGLAVLAKGPVGLLVPMGVYLAATHFSGEWRINSLRHVLWGPLISLVFPGIWLLLIWWQGAPDGFFHELLYKQNVGRASGEFGGHNQPFYYFLMYFPMDFMPWTFLLPLSYTALARVPNCDVYRRRLLAWMVFVVVFFSFSASKRNLYILLVYPAAAIMVAAGIEQWGHLSKRWLRYSFMSLWCFLSLMAAAMLIMGFVPIDLFNTKVLLPVGALLAFGLTLAWRFARQRPDHPDWLLTLALTMFAVFSSFGSLVYPAMNAFKTPDELVKPAREVLNPSDKMLLYRQNGEIFSLYAERGGYITTNMEEFVERLMTEPQTNHFIVAYERDIPRIFQVIDDDYPVTYFRMGGKKLAWFAVHGVPRLREDIERSPGGENDAKSRASE